MTVSYSGEVANSSSFGCFWRILCKWRGSVYKLIWREVVFYLLLFVGIHLMYRYVLDEPQKRTFESLLIYFDPTLRKIPEGDSKTNSSGTFEKVRTYFSSQSESIPMSFVLGFYVTLIVKRWWEQYRLLPWPDSLALFVSAAVPGVDERGRLMRRNIMRYAMLSYVITLQKVSFRVKKRFPTWQHMVDAGLMMESEKKIFEMMDEKADMSKYWMPLIWATNIMNRARKELLIPNDQVVQTMLRELSDIRQRLGSLIGYDTVCVPLVYTQVVSLSVYTYFLAALIGRQFVFPSYPEGEMPETGHIVDLFFPFMTILQFCFYIGWLKVAEVLINPFGEDDDDIELNWLIDRHIKAAYMIVDEMHEEHPELLKDQYWDEVVPKNLPYTVASEHFRRGEPKGSAETYVVKPADSLYANLLPARKTLPDDVYADYESVDTPLVERRKNWFQRQMSRMSSVRSASTAYSSNGLFTRGRINSVYSSPESGLPIPNGVNGGSQQQFQHKMSLYDRLVGRKSTRGNSRRGTIKMNGGAVPMSLKNRPRIPTPDVTKEVVDRENRLASMHHANGMLHSTLTGGTFVAHQLNGVQTHHNGHNQQSYPTDLNLVLLSPIQELDSPTGQHNGTSALAQSVLNPSLHSAGINGVKLTATPVLTTMTLTPVTMTQPMLTSLGFTSSAGSPPPSLHHIQFGQHPQSPTPQLPQGLTLTEVHSSSSEDDGATTSSTASLEGDRSRKASVTSQAKRGEVYV